MHFAIFDAFLQPSWQPWATVAVGCCAALLTLMVGRLVQSRRRSARPAAPPAEPEFDPFETGSATEKRRAARRKGNPIEILISDADAVQEPTRGHVVDRSLGGLCLLLSDEVAVGTVLSLKVRNGPPATPWVQAEVRSCKKDRHGYEVGCQFVRTPPWAVLLLFG
jgi:hypothetical protein